MFDKFIDKIWKDKYRVLNKDGYFYIQQRILGIWAYMSDPTRSDIKWYKCLEYQAVEALKEYIKNGYRHPSHTGIVVYEYKEE